VGTLDCIARIYAVEQCTSWCTTGVTDLDFGLFLRTYHRLIILCSILDS
jgi:hypothetical protein